MVKIFFILFFFSTIILNAQGIITNNSNDATTSMDTDIEQLNYFSQQLNTPLSPSEINITNTGVFIHQIGNNNVSDITTASQISDIQLNQFGNDNAIDLNLKATVIDYSVTQNGNNNTLIEYNNSVNNKQLLERTVQQNGNGQNLLIEGNNSIVDKMRITMNNGAQSLIIRTMN